MRIRIWNLQCAGLSLAALLLAGCEQQPAAAPLPVRTAQTATVPSAQPVNLAPAGSSSASPAPGSANAGFSLPIGGEIPAAAPPPVSASSPSGFGNSGATATAPPSQSPPVAPPRSSPSTGSPAAAERKLVHLSAGIALPQLLPDGTAIGISVDYAVDGGLNRSSRYLWVIKSGAGEVTSDVKLEPSGNLSAFFQQLKPEHRPFSVRIEEVTPGSQRRTIVSNEVTLKTDY